MLILTRRVGETLMIGDSVTVTVLGVKGNQVRIGITAPKDVAVHREEIYQRIQRGEEPSDQGKQGLPPTACIGRLRRLRRHAREAEGAPLLREYGVKSSIEGSNPSVSASCEMLYRGSASSFSLRNTKQVLRSIDVICIIPLLRP